MVLLARQTFRGPGLVQFPNRPKYKLRGLSSAESQLDEDHWIIEMTAEKSTLSIIKPFTHLLTPTRDQSYPHLSRHVLSHRHSFQHNRATCPVSRNNPVVTIEARNTTLTSLRERKSPSRYFPHFENQPDQLGHSCSLQIHPISV